MDFQDNSLRYMNKNYARQKQTSEKLLIFLLVILFIYIYANLLFYSVFYKLQVVGQSMQPTFNAQLSEEDDGNSSIYKDIAVVNQYETGTNGNIIIIRLEEEDYIGIEDDNNLGYIDIIKRLIAKGGQTLTLKYNSSDNLYHYYLNGVKLNESYLDNTHGIMNSSYFNRFKDKFKNDEKYLPIYDNLEISITIPEGYVFALGDNRTNSADSTFYGAFELSQIQGKVAFYYSYNESMFDYFVKQLVYAFSFSWVNL